MRARLILLLLCAAIAAGGTTLAARAWLDSQQPQSGGAAARTSNPVPEPAMEMVEVLVAESSLPAGTVLQAGHLRWQEWPRSNASDHFIVEGVQAIDDVAGAVVRQGISAGEPITDGRIVRPGDRGFLAAMLGPDMRAVTIRVTEASGVGGLIFPGDRVDVILTHSMENGGRTQFASETVLQNIRMLALDQRTDDQNGEPFLAKTATLEVTPKQAEALAVANDMGPLSLALRSVADSNPSNGVIDFAKIVPAPSFTLDSEVSTLLRSETSAPETNPAPAQGRGAGVTIIRGGSSESVSF